MCGSMVDIESATAEMRCPRLSHFKITHDDDDDVIAFSNVISRAVGQSLTGLTEGAPRSLCGGKASLVCTSEQDG